MKRCVILILMILTVSNLFSAERLTVSIANRTINSGIYYADIMVNVPSSDNKWLAAASTIVVKYNSNGLGLTNLDGVNVQNLDSELGSAGYSCTQTDFGPGYMAVNLFTTNPNVNKSGEFRLCTVRWNIVSSTQYDSLNYDSGQCEIFNGMDLMLEYNCSTPSCYKVVNPEPKQLQVTVPTLSTTNISNVASTSASSGGNVTNDGGSSVTARGVCWDTTQSPTIAKSKTSDGTGTGNFSSNITGLQSGTTYYVRAYATNSAGTAYGEQKSFTTTTISVPTLSTTNISNITQTTASSGGNVTNDGGASVTVRGVCWDTTQSPTIANSKTSNGTGTGSFTSSITDLTSNTKYFVRAYATNSVGTGYGEQKEFKTDSSGIIDVPASWDFTDLTGNNSIVVVPKSINPKIDTRDFATGDAIGFFFTRSGQKVCAGYSLWTGNNLQVTVWGDDSETQTKDGFDVSETYTVKIWDGKLGKEYDAAVTYSQGHSYYTVNGFSVMASLSAITTVKHDISLTSGWNMISTFVEPEEEKSMEEIWDSIKNSVTLVKNNAGSAYIPSFDINGIGDWNKYEGYQVHMGEAKTLSITGIPLKPNQTPITLTSGWKIAPYLRNSQMDAEEALVSLVNDSALVLAKNNMGQAYIPDFDINGIGNLVPGQGYQMYLSKNSTLTYPANSQGKLAMAGEPQNRNPRIFIPDYRYTGNNSILLVLADANDGNEIGVYSNDDKLIGSGIFLDGKAAVTIWGDNPQTSVTDGAKENYELRIRNYDVKTGRVSDIELTEIVDGLSGNLRNELTYKQDAFTLAKANIEDSGDDIFNFSTNPNPFSDEVKIEFSLPTQSDVSLKVFSLNGNLVSTLFEGSINIGTHKYSLSGTNLASGEYTVVLTIGNERFIRKVVRIR